MNRDDDLVFEWGEDWLQAQGVVRRALRLLRRNNAVHPDYGFPVSPRTAAKIRRDRRREEQKREDARVVAPAVVSVPFERRGRPGERQGKAS